MAVAFSGGLDSSVLAASAKRHGQVLACAAYSTGSRDATWARRAADELGLELTAVELDEAKVAAALTGMGLPFEPSLMDRSLWCLYSLVGEKARGAGAKVILLGQLADELFGGYAKYVEALERDGPDAAQSIMDADRQEYGRRGRVRDLAAFGGRVQPKFPFEAEEVVEFASSLPMAYKIRGGVRKAILRRAALELGVPEDLAEGAKKAAQYSSGIQKLLA